MADAKSVIAEIAAAVKSANETCAADKSAVKAHPLREHNFPRKSAADIKVARAQFPDCAGWAEGEYPSIYWHIVCYAGGMRYDVGRRADTAKPQYAMTNFGRTVYTRQLTAAGDNINDLAQVSVMPAGKTTPLTFAQLDAIYEVGTTYMRSHNHNPVDLSLHSFYDRALRVIVSVSSDEKLRDELKAHNDAVAAARAELQKNQAAIEAAQKELQEQRAAIAAARTALHGKKAVIAAARAALQAQQAEITTALAELDAAQ